MLSINSIAFKLLTILSVLVLFSNLILSVLGAPRFITFSVIGVRDLSLIALIMTLPFILLLEKRGPFLWLLVLLFWILSGIVFFQSIFFDTAATNAQTIGLFRVVFALSILVISFCWICDFNSLKLSDLNWSSYFDFAVKIFVFICFAEALIMFLGLYKSYLDLINFEKFMQSKGRIAYIGHGILEYRLLTPLFNPSAGGVVLASFFGYFLQARRLKLAVACLVPLLLTVSKTGWVIAFIFIAFRRFNLVTGFILAISAYIFLALLTSDLNALQSLNLNRNIFMHMASIASHLNGLTSGFGHLFSPVGLGNAGTIPDVVFPTKLGRESAVGVGIASIGFPYLILVSLSFYALGSQYSRVGYLLGSMYLLVAFMTEGPATYYIWLPIFMLFLSSHAPR